jgi:hypothetical protein
VEREEQLARIAPRARLLLGAGPAPDVGGSAG